MHVSQGFSITFYHIANLLLKTYWLPYLWKFVQLPCNFAPLQPLKETSEVATGAKCTQIHYSKTVRWLLKDNFSFTTLWIYTTPKRRKTNEKEKSCFTTLWIYTTPKPQKRIFEVATSVCITEHSIAFYYITSLFSEKHIECHACANLFNYPAILCLFKCSNRHLKLLPAQKSRKYTTPKLRSSSSDVCKRFTTLWIYTTPKHLMIAALLK